MPLGPYKNWDECLRAQRRKGKSEESAKKICGYLEQKSKESSGKSSKIVDWLYKILWRHNDDNILD